jgi:hypothetical protein
MMTSHTEEFIEEPITLTRKEYDELCRAAEILAFLKADGVDNWEGYDWAMEKFWAQEEG